MAKTRIPEERDRQQSKILVAATGTLLGILGIAVLLGSGTVFDFGFKAAIALVMSMTFGVVAWALHAATKGAAIWGGVICLLITMTTRDASLVPLRSGLAPLIMLFVLTFVTTRLGRARKTALGLAEKPRGRNAGQVMANLGMGGLVAAATFAGVFDRMGPQDGTVQFAVDVLPVLLLAVLCEATADTVSSEIGQAFGGTPVMLTTWRKMREGTNGAITLVGTLAGVIAALMVAVMGMWGMQMSLEQAWIGLAAGVAGLFFDSLLGATVERKGWLGNDLVNFISTAFAVVVALVVVLVRS